MTPEERTRGRIVALQAIARLMGGGQQEERYTLASEYIRHLESENVRLKRELADVRNVLRNDLVSAAIEGAYIATRMHRREIEGRNGDGDEEAISAAAEDGCALSEMWAEVTEHK